MNPPNTVPPKTPSPKRGMLIGLLLMLLSGCLLVFTLSQARAAARTAAQVERLSPLTVAGLGDTQPGQMVLIEGRISPSTPVQFRDFVAYIRETKGKRGWTVGQAFTPPLRVDCTDGSVQVVNRDYTLDTQTLGMSWQPIVPFPNERFRGIVGGTQVVVIGKVVQNASAIGIAADVIAVGRKADYLASQHAAATWDNNMAYELLIFLIGSGMFLGYWQQLRRKR